MRAFCCLCDFPFSLWGGIILVCMSLALSYVCWIEVNPAFPSRDSQCQSSLTCWHLPQRRRLCAALITVTAGSQITKNPCAVSICSGRLQQMDARCTHNRTHSCGVEARHTHASGWILKGKSSKPHISCGDNNLKVKGLKITASDRLACDLHLCGYFGGK